MWAIKAIAPMNEMMSRIWKAEIKRSINSFDELMNS